MNRFWSKVDKSGECWEWTAYKHPESGYGQFSYNSKTSRAHRVAYELSYGPIPCGMVVCHSCDNVSCQRPDHLFLGTQKDNMHDMKTKGRHGHTKLSEEDVAEIRELLAESKTQQEIADMYDVCRSLISHIKTGRQR